MFNEVVAYIREVFKTPEGFIPLHAPYFGGNEKKYLADTIDSTFVSSVGAYVNRFEEMMAKITGAKYAVATTNGTVALQLSLIVAGIQQGDEVITQPLTFVATANAIAHGNATPVFVDVDRDTMGLSPDALEKFLEENATIKDGAAYNNKTGKRIAACIPMHTFGFPCRIDKIVEICDRWHITVIEDAAESLGSYYNSKHTGTFGKLGTFSFNGNKTVTCGGGGAIVTDDEALAKRAKHISTTAKVPHAWEFVHDEVGYNFRMPNLNAALACAQLEQLDAILANKKELAELYQHFFAGTDIGFVTAKKGSIANNWLNCVILKDLGQRNAFLEATNNTGVMTRPIWQLMNKLAMYQYCQCGDLSNALWLEDRIVNIPSSFRPG
ncbi:MAG: LegC family aminotransferase [Chitinophagaceae bacterium]|nr:LegC family aminotransferase [Chitinophagaceae bacterium]MCB9044871.1 LegC family aminotransferase [Chitinophagales bacterium]